MQEQQTFCKLPSSVLLSALWSSPLDRRVLMIINPILLHDTYSFKQFTRRNPCNYNTNKNVTLNWFKSYHVNTQTHTPTNADTTENIPPPSLRYRWAGGKFWQFFALQSVVIVHTYIHTYIHEDLYSAKNQKSLGAEISSYQCKQTGLKDDMQRFCGYLK